MAAAALLLAAVDLLVLLVVVGVLVQPDPKSRVPARRYWIPVLLGALILAAVGIGLILIFDDHAGVSSIGNLGEWAAAIGTTGAVAAVIWQVRTTEASADVRLNMTFQTEHDRLVEELKAVVDQEQRREIAKVHAWASVETSDPNAEQRNENDHFTITFQNGSLGPIYGPKVFYKVGTFSDPRVPIDCTDGVLTTSLPSGCLVAGRCWSDTSVSRNGERDIALEITFTDAEGVDWRRRSNGKLERREPSANP